MKPSKGAVYIETYGCQMNVGDTEIVRALLHENGWAAVDDPQRADVILINTCSVREGAEQRIWGRLGEMQRHRRRGARVGVIGCMAERLREELIERGVDIVAGPDAYRDLPRLVEHGGVNVELSESETYADIVPWRFDEDEPQPTGTSEILTSRLSAAPKDGTVSQGEHHTPHSTLHTPVSAFISIMRGCNNFCSYCVVPFTRGRERSRDPQTILKEARDLFEKGCREVTLLGQNVNSYRWNSENSATNGSGGEAIAENDEGTENGRRGTPTDFPDLLAAVAAIDPRLRIRFATSHPKDLSDKLIATMAGTPNICNSIHLPAQSGSTRMLGLMNRKYTREWYLERLNAIRRAMPDCAVTTDLIAGFCGETADDHAQTLSLMREVGYDFAYMFKYSERPGTVAARRMADDVSEADKSTRLQQIIALQNELSLENNQRDVGRQFAVLIEGRSKRRADQLTGRTPQNKTVVFDVEAGLSAGDYATVEITGCTQATLFGRVVNNA